MHKTGLVVGKFAPLHNGHRFLIETALRACGKVVILVYSNPDFPEMPQSLRAKWIRQLYPDAVVFEPVGAPPDCVDDDDVHRRFAKEYLERLGIQVDAVFTSEAYGPGFADMLGAHHVMVDESRKHFPVSGELIRANPVQHRAMIPPIVFAHFVRRVVLMGAESTGKSTLAKELAAHFHAPYMPEYGREHYEARNGRLELKDYVAIAKEHWRREDKLAEQSAGIIFVDTNAITTLYYSYYYNGSALPELHDMANSCRQRYSNWYLCGDDIPFEQDGWRDTSAIREKMQRMIRMDLRNRGIPLVELSGSAAQRVFQVCTTLLPAGERQGATLSPERMNT